MASFPMFNVEQKHLDLMTPEELEDYHHDELTESLTTRTGSVRVWLDSLPSLPEGKTRKGFEARKPALGVTQDILNEMIKHNEKLPPVQQRRLFRIVREAMLTRLISCSGAATLEHLCRILEEELKSSVPAPVPAWYNYTPRTLGPRCAGYYRCQNRGCFKTEKFEDETPFGRCDKCKASYYCGRECQVEDWNARHKHLCVNLKKERRVVKRKSRLFHRINANYEAEPPAPTKRRGRKDRR